MLCQSCRFNLRPGFVLAPGSGGDLVPCPDCGGQGVGHCCDGLCAQPDDRDVRPSRTTADRER